jgi:hypothetical protein
MAHWENRPEPRWKDFRFNQPYAKGLKRLREDVLVRVRPSVVLTQALCSVCAPDYDDVRQLCQQLAAELSLDSDAPPEIALWGVTGFLPRGQEVAEAIADILLAGPSG